MPESFESFEQRAEREAKAGIRHEAIPRIAYGTEKQIGFLFKHAAKLAPTNIAVEVFSDDGEIVIWGFILR